MTHERDLEWCAWSRFESRERETESRYIEILYRRLFTQRTRETRPRGRRPAAGAARRPVDARRAFTALVLTKSVCCSHGVVHAWVGQIHCNVFRVSSPQPPSGLPNAYPAREGH